MIEIRESNNGFWIHLPIQYGIIWEYLNITLNDWIIMLKNYNAHDWDYFENREDIEKFKEYLEPLCIMRRLE